MTSVFRNTLAVIIGFIVASAVMMVVETINVRVLYPELAKSAQAATDKQALKELFGRAPTGALVMVLVAWALGSFCGGFVSTLISRKPVGAVTLVLGTLLTLAGVANNVMLPPPIWFWIATFAVLLPFTLIGARLADHRIPGRIDSDRLAATTS